jgi:hypothetical protein
MTGKKKLRRKEIKLVFFTAAMIFLKCRNLKKLLNKVSRL